MSVRKNHSGRITGNVYSAKYKSFTFTVAGQRVTVGEGLLNNIALSQGLTLKQLLRSVMGSTLSCVINQVKAGEPVVDRDNKPVMDGAVARTYSKDHPRFEDVSIELSTLRLESLDKAEAYGDSMKSLYLGGSLELPQLSNAPLAEEPEPLPTANAVIANADLQPVAEPALDENATN